MTNTDSRHNQLDPSIQKRYGEAYYQHSCSPAGGPAYARNVPEWAAFFSQVGAEITLTLGPATALDAGCAIGLLVEELRRHGIAAEGIDISEYAISQAPAALRAFMRQADLTDPHLLPGRRFDLVICMEVVEHLTPEQGEVAIANLCRWSDTVLFSSSPEDFSEVTHVNVQRPGYWAERFARHGFYLDLAYDASYIAPWAMLFRRGTPAATDWMAAGADTLYHVRRDLKRLRASPDAFFAAESLALTWQPGRMARLRTTWMRLRRRQQLLRRTASLTLREEGPGAFIQQSIRWLRGERGHWAQLTRGAANRSGLASSPVPAERHNPLTGPFLRYAFSDAEYARHAALHEPDDDALRAQAAALQEWAERPLLSVVTPVHNPPAAVLDELIASLRRQTYDQWEWIAADSSSDPAVWERLVRAAAEDPRIRPLRLEQNRGISGNTNVALGQATGLFVVLLDHDDTLASQALYAIADVLRANPAADFIYSDEDKLDEYNRRCEPFFKPNWSPELLLSGNYLIHVAAFRRTLLDRVAPFDPATDGAQDWDLFLRISEVTDRFVHIPQVLYHWRKSHTSTAGSHLNKPYVAEAQRRAISGHLQRLGLQNARARFDPGHIIYSVTPIVEWEPRRARRISIIVLTTGDSPLLQPCLESVFRLTRYPDFEVVLVNSDGDRARLARYEHARQDVPVQIVDYAAEPFNFADACNLGATHTTGDLLLFMNDDIEVLQREWLQLLAQWLDIPGVGIVGPKLLYPTGKIQHAGVVIGLNRLAGHVFAGEVEHSVSLFGTDAWCRNYLAVTGACLLTTRALFDQLSGFDPAYRMDFSDIAFCVRAHAAGWRTVYTPFARLVHHESATRSLQRYRADFERAGAEFLPYLEQGDPYFNPNCSSLYNYPVLRLDEESPAALYRSMLAQVPAGETFSVADLIQAGGEPG